MLRLLSGFRFNLPVWTLVVLMISASLAPRARAADGLWPKSKEAAGAAIAAEPSSAEDWVRRAWALSRYQSDHDGAAAAAAKALELAPDSYGANEMAGIIAQMRGEYDAAFEHYLLLVSQDQPQSELYLSRMDTLNLSRAQRDRLLLTLEAAAENEKLSPVYRSVLDRNIASLHLERGELSEAAEAIEGLRMLTDWMVIGPFDNEENGGFGQEYGPETEIDYEKSYQGRDREVEWRRLRHVDGSGAIDFDAVMYPNTQVLAYALTFVHVDDDTNLVLRFGAGNAVKVWVNDRLVESNDLDVAFRPDQYETPCVLRKGWNKLLFKVCERSDRWMLGVRVTAADGKPMTLRTDAKPGEPLEIRKTPIETEAADFEFERGTLGTFQHRMDASGDEDPAAAYYLGQAQRLTNRRMRAVATFEKLVSLNPDCADHHKMLAQAYLADERPEKALVELKEAVEIEPGNVEAMALLGRFYDGRNLFEKALATLRKAAKANPDWPDAQYYLMELYDNKDWEEHAWRQAEWLLEHKPDVPWIIETYASKSKSRGFREQAREYYNKVLARQYNHESARRELLSMAVAEGNLAEAMAQYDVLLRLEPLSINTRLALARLLMQYKDYDAALKQCRDCLQICEANFRVHRLIGIIHQRRHEDDQAVEAWNLALKYNPDDKWMREYIEFLQPESIAAFDEYGISSDDAEQIIERRVDPADYPKADAVRLLDHLVVQLNDDGSYTALTHKIVQILTDSGRERFTSMSRGGYDAKVKRAVVIQPDGSEVEASRVSGGVVKFGQLQVGSIIELKSQYRGSSNEWLSRHYTRTFSFQGGTPALRAQFVLLVPTTRSIRYAAQGDQVELDEGVFENHVVYDWKAEDVPMLEPESNRPPPADIAALVQVSTIEDWDEIARWEYSLVKDQFVADEAVKEKARELTEGVEDRIGKIRAVANFVMQKVQYRQDYDRLIMGMKPHKAGNVLEKEVGDCKDKATLLITMLREIGVPANYVTLRTRSAGQLRKDIPSNQCNHAIVCIPRGDGFADGLWIDGTANYSGIDTLPWQDQGVEALVFDEDGNITFVETPVAPAEDSLTEFAFDIDLNPDGSASVAMTWTARGQQATSLRRVFEAEGLRQQRLEQFANYLYPGSRVTSIEFSDLENRDIPVAIRFEFEAASVGQLSGEKMVLKPRNMLTLTQEYANKTERTYDIWNYFANTQRFVERYRLPNGFKVDVVPESADMDSEWLDYSLKTSQDGDAVEVERTLAVKTLLIPKEHYEQIRAFCIKADKHQEEPLILVREAAAN